MGFEPFRFALGVGIYHFPFLIYYTSQLDSVLISKRRVRRKEFFLAKRGGKMQ